MSRAKKTRKFAQMKRTIKQRDSRLKQNLTKSQNPAPQKEQLVREVPQASSAMFFMYNSSLKPPYQILVDTNFISHSKFLRRF
jgi:U3 small nucleolar RNA-associated protein 24